MSVSSFLSEQRLAGIILILSFISFAIGAGLPTMDEKGNMGIHNLPYDVLFARSNSAANECIRASA